MERNLSASEQLAQLQRATNATPIVSLPSRENAAAGPTREEVLMANIQNPSSRRVTSSREGLNQIQNIIKDQESRRVNETIAAIAASDRPNRSPFAPIPSLSQQVSDENAAQDRMIINAYNNAGVNLSPTDLNNMRGQLEDRARIGDPVKEIDPTFLYERRVADAYKNIGREGTAVDREGSDYFLNKLKSGEVSPTNFNDFFLGTAANYTGPGAPSLIDSINKARTLTNMPLTNTTQLAAAQDAAAGQGTTSSEGTTSSGETTPSGGATRQQVLDAYANNPRAVRDPDPEAIEFFMQPGKLADFDAIVEQVRDANPELAKEIDADRFVAPSVNINPSSIGYGGAGVFGTQNQNQGLMRFLRNGGSVKK